VDDDMDNTASIRQQSYRQRHGKTDRALGTRVSLEASAALHRMAQHHGVSLSAELETLLLAAEEAILSGLPQGAERDTYMTLPEPKEQPIMAEVRREMAEVAEIRRKEAEEAEVARAASVAAMAASVAFAADRD
jgi:hypothetical protein